MESLLDWLTRLPPSALYAAIGVIAAVENFFPPIPADTAVALGAFLAAQGQRSLLGVWIATFVGNVGGAMVMYALGRRFGARRLENRLLGQQSASAEARLRALYGRYGVGALVLSRFLPGVRAIVPPFAGALRVPVAKATLAIGVASGIWYGLIAYLGYSLGSWGEIREMMARSGRWLAIGAVAIGVVAFVVWWVRFRGRRAAAGP